MISLIKSTYTYGMLKDNILKVLGEYSINGNGNSSAGGFLADMEKRLVSTLNICLRRVILSLPLLEKKVELQFLSHKAELPCDFGEAVNLFVTGIGNISEGAYRISGNEVECTAVSDGAFAELVYKVNPGVFTPDMRSDAEIALPDITVDALCYLTASELCPAEYAELYSKLMYKYRDICMNYYNCEKPKGGRNSFFASKGRSLYGMARGL